jgi:hypothetical protein
VGNHFRADFGADAAAGLPGGQRSGAGEATVTR